MDIWILSEKVYLLRFHQDFRLTKFREKKGNAGLLLKFEWQINNKYFF